MIINESLRVIKLMIHPAVLKGLIQYHINNSNTVVTSHHIVCNIGGELIDERII